MLICCKIYYTVLCYKQCDVIDALSGRLCTAELLSPLYSINLKSTKVERLSERTPRDW